MTKIFRDLTRKFVGLDIKKSVLTTKMRVFDHKNMYLTMKLEPVLTTKIVDNFVRFGIPYPLPVLSPAGRARNYVHIDSEDSRIRCVSGTSPPASKAGKFKKPSVSRA